MGAGARPWGLWVQPEGRGGRQGRSQGLLVSCGAILCFWVLNFAFVTAAFRYHSRPMQLTHLKCTVHRLSSVWSRAWPPLSSSRGQPHLGARWLQARRTLYSSHFGELTTRRPTLLVQQRWYQSRHLVQVPERVKARSPEVALSVPLKEGPDPAAVAPHAYPFPACGLAYSAHFVGRSSLLSLAPFTEHGSVVHPCGSTCQGVSGHRPCLKSHTVCVWPTPHSPSIHCGRPGCFHLSAIVNNVTTIIRAHARFF